MSDGPPLDIPKKKKKKKAALGVSSGLPEGSNISKPKKPATAPPLSPPPPEEPVISPVEAYNPVVKPEISEADGDPTFPEAGCSEDENDSSHASHDFAKSPYAKRPVTFFIGPKSVPYYISRHLLPPDWSPGLQESIRMADVDLETGHTLVHYFYTGSYERLPSPTTGCYADLKRDVSVYIMAKKYEIEGLQQLATNSIERNGWQLEYLECLEAIKSDFNQLSSVTSLNVFLSLRFESELDYSEAILENEAFKALLDNPDISRFIVRCMKKFYGHKIRHLNFLGQGLSKELEDLRNANENEKQRFTFSQLSRLTREKMSKRKLARKIWSQMHPEDSFEDIEDLAGSDEEMIPEAEFDPDSPELVQEAFPDEEPDPEVLEFVQEAVVEAEADKDETTQALADEEEVELSLESIPEIPEPSPVGEMMPSVIQEAPASIDSENSASESVLRLKLGHDMQCPNRASHVMDGNTWKSCRPCRVFMQEVLLETTG